MAKFPEYPQSNAIDEKIKQIASFHFPFITETYLEDQVYDLKTAVLKLKLDCDLYLDYINSI